MNDNLIYDADRRDDHFDFALCAFMLPAMASWHADSKKGPAYRKAPRLNCLFRTAP